MTATVRITHEALLHAWDRAENLIEADRADLIRLGPVEEGAARWDAAGRPDDMLIPRGSQLAEATALRRDFGDDLALLARTYVERSEEVGARRTRREHNLTRFFRVATPLLAVLLLAALAASFLAYQAEGRATIAADEADRQASRAQQAQKDAQQRLQESRVATSRFLADHARERFAEGRLGDAVALARQANPHEQDDWPDVKTAENALFFALHGYLSAPIRPEVDFVGHEGSVRGGTFVANTGDLLTWSYDGTARLWDTRSGRENGRFEHDAAVRGLEVTSNGQSLMTWSFDKTVRLWNLYSDDDAHVYNHDDVVIGASFSNDQKQLLSWSFDNTARLWSSDSGAEIARFDHDGVVWGAQFSGDDKRVLTHSFDGTARLWDVGTGSLIATMTHDANVHMSSVTGAMFFDEDKRIATWSRDGTARIWDAYLGEELLALVHDQPVVGASLVNNESNLITWSGNLVRVWDTVSGDLIFDVSHRSSVLGVVFSSDESVALSWSAAGELKVWNVKTGEVDGHSETGSRIAKAQFSPSMETVLAHSYDMDVIVFTYPQMTEARRLRHDGTVRGAAYDGSGQFIWTRSDDGLVRLWRANGSLHAKLPHDAEVLGVAFNGDKFATFSADSGARLWSIAPRGSAELDHSSVVRGVHLGGARASNLITWTVDGDVYVRQSPEQAPTNVLPHDSTIISVHTDEAGENIVTYSEDGYVRVWNAAEGTLVSAVQRQGKPRSAAYSSDAERMLSIWDSGYYALYDTRAQSVLWEGKATAERGGVHVLDGSTHGLVWSSDGRIIVVDLQTGEIISRFSHSNLSGALLSESGSTVLSWSESGLARVYDVKSVSLLAESQHATEVRGMDLAPDGVHVLSWGDEAYMKIWNIRTGHVFREFHLNNNLQGAFWLDEERIVTWSHNGVSVWGATSGAELRKIPANLQKVDLIEGTELVFLDRFVGWELWDLQTNDLIAESAERSETAISPDGRLIAMWTDSAQVKLVPVKRSVSDAVKESDAILAQLRPLTEAELCDAYLQTDQCEIAVPDRAKAMEKDTRNVILEGHGTNPAPKGAREAEDKMKIELAVNDRSEVIIFHDTLFSIQLRYVMYNKLTNMLSFKLQDGSSRSFGVAVSDKLRRFIEDANVVLMVQMDPGTREAVSGEYFPFLIY